MLWHLHYDDLVRHKIFKLLIQSIFWILLFDLDWDQFKIIYSFKTPGHFTEYLLLPDITCPKTNKFICILQPNITCQVTQITGQPRQLYELSQKVSPLRFSLASSGSWNFSFSFKSSSSLCWSSIFSLCCWTCSLLRKATIISIITQSLTKYQTYICL